MKLTLVSDKKLDVIISNQEEMKKIMNQTLASIEEALDLTIAKLSEAKQEQGDRAAALETFLGDRDPAVAVAKLAQVVQMAQELADIVPNE